MLHETSTDTRCNYLILDISSKTRNSRGYYEEWLVFKCWDSIHKRVHDLVETADSTLEHCDTRQGGDMNLKVTGFIPAWKAVR
jgi:hypothetical protein